MNAGPRPTRRAVLAAAALAGATGGGAALSGCTSRQPRQSPPPPDPDELLRTAALTRERSLLAAYDAALLSTPDRAVLLTVLRGEHAQHVAALAGTDDAASPSARVGSSGSPAAGSATARSATAGPLASNALPGTTGSAAPAVPTRRPTGSGDDAASLVRSEREASAAHGQAALQARDGELAGLLASLAASEASHPVALA